jgi:hypothetical protein
MKMAKSTWFVGLALGAIFYSPPAEANVILSVFQGAVFYMVLSLIPVIVVESIVLSIQLGLSALQAVLWAFLANCVSTAAGIPFAGSLLGNIRNLPFGWLSRAAGAVMDFDDYEDEPEAEPVGDATEIAGLILLFLLFFVASCLIELGVLAFAFGATTKIAEIAMATVWANVWTYGLIAAIPAVIILVLFLRGDLEEVTAKPAEADAVKPTQEDGGLSEDRNLSRSVVPITVPVRPSKQEENPHLDADQQDQPKKVA